MSTSDANAPAGKANVFLGGALVIAGTSLAVPFGFCTMLLLVLGIWGLIYDAKAVPQEIYMGWWIIALVFGMTAVGVVLIRIGLAIRYRK